MFNQVIETTPFCTPTTNRLYEDKIYGESYGYDVSFVSTLRALLYKRVGDGKVYFFKEEYHQRGDLSLEYYAIRIGNVYRNTVKVVSLTQYEDGFVDRWRGMIAEKLNEFYDEFSFTKMEKVTQFFRKAFGVDCYVDFNQRSVLLVVDSLDRRKIHYLQCAIPAFMPWFFPADNPLTELERALIESLREKSPDNYIKCLAEIASNFDFRTEEIRSMLEGIENEVELAEISNCRSNIEYYNRQINDCNSRVADFIRKIYDAETRILGYEARMEQNKGNESILMEYFIANKVLHPVSKSGTSITFVVADRFEYCNEDVVQTCLENPYSRIYSFGMGSGNHAVSDEAIKRFVQALMIDKTIQMKMCAAYAIDLRGAAVNGAVHAMGGYRYGAEFSDYMPNPHVQNYTCMGNYVQLILECLENHNTLGAIENCIASAKSFNPSDGTVCDTFMSQLFDNGGTRAKCIIMPDGRCVTPVEAAKELEEENNDGENS